MERSETTSRFDGRVALVTGAAHGIGRSIAGRLLSQGASVVIADIDGSAAAATAAELGGDDAVVAVTCDISNRAEVEQAVKRCVDQFGSLDVLAANAASADVVNLMEISENAWRRMLDVNLTGAFFSIQEAARVMIPLGRGAIVFTASTNAFWVEANTAHYSATKFGVLGLMKTAALDLARFGVRVNAVSPGIVDTRLAAHLVHDPVQGPDYLKRIPLGRYAHPRNIADAVAFLASDEASYITGENLVVDGGVTIGASIDVPAEPLPGALR